jgi:hypothetical protein
MLHPPSSPTVEAEYDALQALLRLMVGVALEGSGLFLRRLQEWEAVAAVEIAAESETETTAPTPDDPLRQALIGLILQSSLAARQQLRAADRLAGKMLGTVSTALTPLANSRLMQPARQRAEALATRGESIVERWVRLGRAEEPQIRRMAHFAANDTIDELIRHMADNQEIRQLVQQQSVGLATEVVGGVRSRTVSADALVERLARSLLRRPSPRPNPDEPASADE